MLDKFGNWWNTYTTEITWWLIGWLTWGFLDSLARGSYVFALIDAGLIFLNYSMWKKRF